MTGATASLTEFNRQTISRAFSDWHDGTRGLADLLGPEVVWRIEGHSYASKTYTSKQQLIDELLEPFAERFSPLDPLRPITIRELHADGDSVIVIWDGRGTATDGQLYENTYAWFMRMDNGKVIDATAFYDSLPFDDLWTRIQPR